MGLKKDRFRDEYQFTTFDSEYREVGRSAVVVFDNRLDVDWLD